MENRQYSMGVFRGPIGAVFAKNRLDVGDFWEPIREGLSKCQSNTSDTAHFAQLTKSALNRDL